MATARTKYQPRPVTCTPPAQVDQAQFGQIRQLGQFAAEVVAEAQAVSASTWAKSTSPWHMMSMMISRRTRSSGLSSRPRSVAKRPDSIAS